MNEQKKLELRCEAILLNNLFEHLSSGLPGTREVRIQAAKLNRLLGQADDAQIQRALKGSSKKARKREGEQAAKIGQQARKVRSIVEGCLKEALRQDSARRRTPFSNAEFRVWKLSFESAIKAQVKDIVKQVNEQVERRMADPSVRAGFARLLGRRRSRKT